jgi:TRAP-type mannitol/chloroaromatic compound transport system permease small subunit
LRSLALRAIGLIDRFSGWSVNLVAVLLAPLVLANVVEVFMRYVLGAPTTWAADVTVMTYGALFMLGSAYAMYKGAHVRTDIFWDRYSVRAKGVIESLAYLLLFLPVMGIIFGISLDDLAYSWEIDERSTVGLWRPVLWPFRAVIPAAAALMFVQGVSELLKALWAAGTGEELLHRDKVLV